MKMLSQQKEVEEICKTINDALSSAGITKTQNDYSENSKWVREYFDTYVVVAGGGENKAYPYVIDENRSVIFGDPVDVEETWVPKVGKSLKVGARNNSYDKERIKQIREAAKTIQNLTNEMDPENEEMKSAKMDGFILSEFNIMDATVIKASGDMELDVLLVPFGGPIKGKDTDGQFFDKDTNIQHEIYKTIPAYYYHGFDPKGRPQGEPEIIGMMHYDRTDSSGHWYKCLLDKKNDYAKRIWKAAKDGNAKASSGSISHIVRAEKSGRITLWPVVEGSLIDEGERRHPANAYAVALPVLKAKYDKLSMELPEADKAADKEQILPRSIKMEKEELEQTVAVAVAEALKSQNEAAAAKAAQEEEIQKKIDAAVAAKTEELEKQIAENNRLPGGVYQSKFADTNKFDGLDAADMSTMIGVLKSAGKQVSESAYKSLALKLEEDKTSVGESARKAMKGMKANEIDYSTLSSYGDEWVGVAYSQSLWESIRLANTVVNKIPSVEFPMGVESMVLPLESTDPTWYKVAEATSSATSYAGPTPTVTASKLGTGNVTMTLAKLGARVLWTGELDESSMIPFATELRRQLAISGQEYLESAVIDGDTETGATTNINDIAGTPAGTEYFMVFNGFRKSPLITTTANARSAAGNLDVTDYLETLKLMGGAGINALDQSKTEFIIDPNTYFKSLTLPEVMTRDSLSSPTIESGRLTGLWGYRINVSGNMHRASSVRKANSAGKVDVDTTTNNAYGAILAVRFDQWKLGWMRRIKIETARWAASDTNEIVATMRVGLIQRDTEASAETYYVGV